MATMGRSGPKGEPADAQAWPVDDRRAHPRHEAPSYLRALDVADGRSIGEVEDMSLGGFKLQLAAPIPRGATFDLRLDLCIDGRQRQPINVRARNIWLHRVDHEGVTHAGFVYLDLSAKARAQIEAFFAELSA